MTFNKIIISFAVLVFLIAIGCNSKMEFYKFEWKMSAENHTGTAKDLYKEDGKHRGMSAFRWGEDPDEAINQLIKNNVEWVAIIPFLFQENNLTKEMNIPEVVGAWNRRDSSRIHIINQIHSRGMHVMLKPHLWMRDGWRSEVRLDSEDEWGTWFESYRKNMIHNAMLAEKLNVELLWIGAELMSSILEQPEKWDLLIKEVREVYSGKLTYAANWDAEYAEVTFWDQMDYIGIQAYFPLTNHANPSLGEIQSGWERHIKMLKKFSKKHKKPILFSEVGYRSDNTATIEPWVWESALNDSISMPSNETQNLAYEALFRELWSKKWFAGMYFWQWHNTTKEVNVYNDRGFTPRYKPAENTMAKWYGKD